MAHAIGSASNHVHCEVPAQCIPGSACSPFFSTSAGLPCSTKATRRCESSALRPGLSKAQKVQALLQLLDAEGGDFCFQHLSHPSWRAAEVAAGQPQAQLDWIFEAHVSPHAA